MIHAVVIDDEFKARETILKLLETYCPEVSVIATAGSVREGLKVLSSHQPDLLLLDIKMGDGTGFDLLRKHGKPGFPVVFITAFEEFAIRAIKFSAIDYILKPIDPDELVHAVRKAGEIMNRDSMKERLDTLFDNLDTIGNDAKKVVLKTSDTVHIVGLREIIRCESEKNLTHVHTIVSGRITVSKTLKEFNEMLSGYNFFRAHQSHLININHVKRFEKKNGGVLVMDDDSIVPVSTRKKDELMKLFRSF
jgi:two-component system LytT family response regulator